MPDILEELAEAARERVAAREKVTSIDELRARAEELAGRGGAPSFAEKIRADKAARGIAVIAEVKRASPSKGLIARDFPYLDIARDYETGGASAISVLTEPTRFLGSDENLREIAAQSALPVLRKDFVVDRYMLYEAKCLGAAAALLIVSLRSKDELREDIALCQQLGMDALVEVHDERELDTALAAGATIVGCNNRNLRDFTVERGNSRRLAALLPPGVQFVAESGVRYRADVLEASEYADAVLVGEALMRSPDRRAALQGLLGE